MNPSTTVLPALTGDNAQTILFVVLAVVAILVVVLLACKDKIFKPKG